METIELYTDGACSGNPGKGGWAYVIISKQKKCKGWGYVEFTTNNRMELMAIIKGLESIETPSDVLVITDSRYVMDAFAKGWIKSWKKNGWMTANKQPVKNRDLWEILLGETLKHKVEWQWIKGHSGHLLNEECDELARQAILDSEQTRSRFN